MSERALPWPSDAVITSEAKRKVSAALYAVRNGYPLRVVPGFHGLMVDGHEVGSWVARGDIDGSDDSLLIGASWITSEAGYETFASKELRDWAEKTRRERRRSARLAPDNPEKRLEDTLAEARRARQHAVEQQVRVPGGWIDIVDHDDRLLIECKATTSTSAVMTAVDQLDRYLAHFPGYRPAIGLPENPSERLRRSLRAAGIEIVFPESGA